MSHWNLAQPTLLWAVAETHEYQTHTGKRPDLTTVPVEPEVGSSAAVALFAIHAFLLGMAESRSPVELHFREFLFRQVSLAKVRSAMHLTAQTNAERPWLWLLAFAFCAEAIFLASFVGPQSHAPDFYHIHFVPAAVRSELNVYEPRNHSAIAQIIDEAKQQDDSTRLSGCVNINRRLYASGFCPTATPFLYAVHSLTLLSSFDVQFWSFHMFATALCWVGLFLIARASGFGVPMSWLITGLVMSFCWGLFLDMQLANVTRYQLFGLAVAMAAGRSTHKWGMVIAGFALALGCAYKPTILPSLAFWLFVLAVDRRWHRLMMGALGMVLGAAIAFVFPLILFDSLGCWWNWKQFAGAELSSLAANFPGNYSLSAALLSQGQLWATQLPWALGLLFIAMFASTAARSSVGDRPTPGHDLRMAVAIAVGPLWAILASPLTWIQYSALVMPLAIVLLGATPPRKTSRRIWGAFVSIATALSGGILQRFFSVEAFWLDASILWIGWLGLLTATIWLLFSIRAADLVAANSATARPNRAGRFFGWNLRSCRN